jgi:Kef-type K+ transport system membrane component KefB
MLPKIAVALAGVLVVGRWVLPWFLARTLQFGNPSGFVALTLLAVFAAALSMEWADLSMSLGAFLLGLQIPKGEVKHRIESVTGPATEIMLALFFVAVGMSIDLPMLRDHWAKILGIVLAVMAIKGGVLFGLGRTFGLGPPGALRLALLLAQAGEFCFVLFAAIKATGMGRHDLFEIAVLGVSISMALTPVLAKLGARWSRPRRAEVEPVAGS